MTGKFSINLYKMKTEYILELILCKIFEKEDRLINVHFTNRKSRKQLFLSSETQR